MRGKVARQIRKAVYGEQSSAPNARKYFRGQKSGMIIADELRRSYQNAKTVYKRG